LRKSFQVTGDRRVLSPREPAAQVGLDQLGEQGYRVTGLRLDDAPLFRPEALQGDFTVLAPLVLEQLHGVIHAVESARGADRGEERLHVQPPESCIESWRSLRKRCTRRIFQPVRSAISELEYCCCLSTMIVRSVSSTRDRRRSWTSLACATWLAV